MPISFNSIPANWKMPLYWVEVDPSMAGLPVYRQAILVVGYGNPASAAPDDGGSTVPFDIPIAVGSKSEARAFFGVGSMMDNMFERVFDNNFAAEVWGLPIAEPTAGVAASGTITVSAPPTGAGTLALYINGRRVQVGVAADDTADEVAASIADAISADPGMPVTVSVAAAVVTLTARHKGIDGNQIDMRDNYGGSLAGERMPTGLVLTYSDGGKLSGGTGTPDMDVALANLGDEPFEYVALAFTDSTSLVAWENEYGFSDSGRWGWMRQLYGHIFSAYKDTYQNLITWGPNNNSPIVSVMALEKQSPTAPWEYAAAYTAKAARALLNDPARPLQTLTLQGCLPAPKHQKFTMAELNAMATVGLATQRPNGDGIPAIMRDSTTYQRNLYSQPDDAYEVVTTLATLARLFRNQRQAITSKFPRHKLADDGTRFGPGQAIVTPKTIKAELVAEYRVDEYNGLVENAIAFKQHLIVERDPNDPNRVNVLYPPDLVNQLRIFAVLAQFRLQYDRGVDISVA
ncbi:phage tail sheath C-terminal domain-containing protein [Bradyrhizobium sp. BRP23]|uniref:phage tail sheath C-terminal domain-containing protein n=1 Tax=Bradyrhizobium sp. BRP23 TaxID=2793820 RepID=UPI001CD73B10|nr:phage tail sheath C-terminal domain-containing protein [Bradyrhizobium sp. BRP23]MCA1419489.1 phage tail sheath subtilisin-like domain-containing protein [Bradyrhizobium sp. BRP23]